MKRKLKKNIAAWWPVILWCGLIFFLSSQPVPPPAGNLFFDLLLPFLAHLIEFGMLFALVWRATRNYRSSFLFGFFYSLTDEFHQYFVPTRTPSLADILIDILGMLLAWFCLVKLVPKLPAKLRSLVERLRLI
jgi:VanZ family protein